MEFLIRDRLSWLRFLGFDLGAPTPDRNTIWTFRERLIRAGATEELFATFDRELRRSGYLAMGGQIVDATLVSAPKQRNTDDEKQAIKAGRRAAEIRPDQPTKAAQTDTQARWTVKTVRRREPAGTQRRLPEIAIPVFDYKSRIAIDRAYGFIRRSAVTDAACHDGRISHIHRKKPPGRVMPKATARANTRQIGGPHPHRACLRPSEGSHGPGHPDHRAQAGRGQDRARQPRIQLSAPDLP